jgi:hypothetical protein
MHTLRHLVLPTFLAMALAGCAVTPKLPQEISVDSVVKEINKALQEISDKRPADLPAFESAEVALETVTKEENNGEFKLLVVSLGSTISTAMSQTVSFKLVPPPPRKGITDKAIGSQLSKAIIKAAEDIHQALENQPSLKLKQLSASVKFEVENSASGGVEVELTPVTLGGKYSKAKGVSHVITLNFEVPDK